MNAFEKKKNSKDSAFCNRACEIRETLYEERRKLSQKTYQLLNRYERDLKQLGTEIDTSESAKKNAIPNLIADVFVARRKRNFVGAISSFVSSLGQIDDTIRNHRRYERIYNRRKAEAETTINTQRIREQDTVIRARKCECRREYKNLEWGT